MPSSTATLTISRRAWSATSEVLARVGEPVVSSNALLGWVRVQESRIRTAFLPSSPSLSACMGSRVSPTSALRPGKPAHTLAQTGTPSRPRPAGGAPSVPLPSTAGAPVLTGTSPACAGGTASLPRLTASRRRPRLADHSHVSAGSRDGRMRRPGGQTGGALDAWTERHAQLRQRGTPSCVIRWRPGAPLRDGSLITERHGQDCAALTPFAACIPLITAVVLA
jgi:hypothetical protein